MPHMVTFPGEATRRGKIVVAHQVQELPVPSQYRIVLVSSPEMHWQRRSLHALSCLATQLVTIQS